MIIDRLASLFGDFEFDRPAGFSLANGGAVDGIAMKCNIFHPEADQVTSAQFAVDR